MKVFFISIVSWQIIEGELVDSINETKPLKKIKTMSGVRFVPPTTKLWTNKTDMLVYEFANQFKKLGKDKIMNRYNLSQDEAKQYLDLAKEQHPEKFI